MTPDPRKLEIDWLTTAGGAFAAVSSIATVGGALYSQCLARSHQRLAQMHTAAMRKVGVARAEVRRAARLPGDKRISLIAAGLFAAAVLAITAFELAAGHSVSSITGGT